MDFLDILSLTAIFSTVGLFLCGIPICQQIAAKGSTEGISAAPFLLGTIGCMFWLRYGFFKQDSTVITVNGIGVTLEVIYLLFYYVYSRNKRSIGQQITVIAGLTVGMVLYVNWRMVDEPDKALEHLGLMCLTLNILNFAAPLAGLRDVMSTQSTENLPLPLCVANLFVSLQWFYYGILVGDTYIKTPNFFGIILALLQLSLFLIYPRKRRSREAHARIS